MRNLKRPLPRATGLWRLDCFLGGTTSVHSVTCLPQRDRLEFKQRCPSLHTHHTAPHTQYRVQPMWPCYNAYFIHNTPRRKLGCSALTNAEDALFPRRRQGSQRTARVSRRELRPRRAENVGNYSRRTARETGSRAIVQARHETSSPKIYPRFHHPFSSRDGTITFLQHHPSSFLINQSPHQLQVLMSMIPSRSSSTG